MTLASPSPVHLDVRSVEPKHRFELIMGAYRSLRESGTLELAVDHDPQCMYYTLKAEYGDEQFSFVYLEQGPETWRVLVTKLCHGSQQSGGLRSVTSQARQAAGGTSAA